MSKALKDAESLGPANVNETTPAEQRKPEGAPQGAGPQVGSKGEYLPATYPTASGNTRTDR